MQALARVEQHGLQFTEEQSQMIRDTYANGATEGEFKVLMEVAKTRNLNPLLRQVHFVKRWDKDKSKSIWAAQVSIDGLRSVADRTGQYDGQDEPENEYAPDGKLVLVRLKVYRKGISRPFVGIARWSEYVQTTKDGSPTRFWREMPHTMLAKCAEALAMRKAFPEDTSGLYINEEMMQADDSAKMTPTERQLPQVNPHDDGADYSEATDTDLQPLADEMARAEYLLTQCDSYEKVLELQAIVGTVAKQSPLTKAIQAAKEARKITPEQHARLSKSWQHINRELTKTKPPGLLLRYPAPDVTASFVDADPEAFDRSL